MTRLLPLTTLGLVIYALVTGLTADLDASRRLVDIAANLVLLSVACYLAVPSYSARFRSPDQGPVPLGSWQNQLLVFALRSVLPLCGIVLALIIPSSSLVSLVIVPIFLLAAIMLFAPTRILRAHLARSGGMASDGSMHTPPTD